MSHSRTGLRTPKTSTIAGIEKSIQRAHDLVSSTDPASIKQLWEELCQKYLDARRIGLTDENFPYWILHNIRHEAIPQMIDVVYGKGARKIETYYPCLPERFGVPQWQFVLFFGRLPQNKVRALNDVTKDRRDVTFGSLYRELCRIRSKKEALPLGPFDFTPAEIKACFQDSNSGDEDGGVSSDTYQNDDEIDFESIHVASSREDDSDHDSEHNEDDFDNVFNSPINHNLSTESSSSVTDVPDEHVASPIHATSSTSVVNPAACAPNTRRRVLGAGRLPDSGPMADTIVTSDCAVVDIQGQTTCTNNTTDLHIHDLRNLLTSKCKVLDSFQAKHEELKREAFANLREGAETLEDVNSVVEWFKAQFECELISEGTEAGNANWSRFVALRKRRNIVKMKDQEHRAKRLKLDADIKEFSSMFSSATPVLTDAGPQTRVQRPAQAAL